MIDRSRLREFMLESFNEDELADLVFDYFPNARSSMAQGMSLGQKVRVLIDFANRYGRFDHLTVVVEKLRPEAYCDYFKVDHSLPPDPTTAARDPNKVFISYANSDAEFATRLAGDLRARGTDVWMAPDSIMPGEKWVAAIERGLRESGIFLLVLTPEGVDSKWVSQETQVAIMLENEGKMRIFPLRVTRAEVPLLLSTRQHISFERDYERGLTALLAALRPGSTRPASASRPVDSAPLPAAAAPAPPARPITETQVVGDMAFPVLIIDWPDEPNQEVALTKATTTLGRAPDNDITLSLSIVSSHHLRLDTVEEDDAYRVSVTDLGSRNGTFLSGRRLTPHTPQPMAPGDVLHLGDRMGRSISLILRPSVAAVASPMPVANGRSPLMGNGRPPAPAPELAAASPSTGASPLSRIPIWAYAAAGLLLVALLALFALRGRGGDDGTTGDATLPAATAALAAADVQPTATEAAMATPTSAPTDEPTAEPSPTSAPATATSAPTDEPATAEAAAPPDEPTAEPTLPPTLAALVLPTQAPGFAISRATPLGFEALGEWVRDEVDSRAAGEIAVSADQPHAGLYAMRLGYDFAGTGDDYVLFRAARTFRIDSDGARRFIKAWVRGDGAPVNVSLILEDNEGERWKVFLGEVGGAEWQQLDGFIGDISWPSGVFNNPGNGEVDFPVRLYGLHIDDATPSFIGAGAIYLDDITVE